VLLRIAPCGLRDVAWRPPSLNLEWSSRQQVETRDEKRWGAP
jgi:hypothetical protein